MTTLHAAPLFLSPYTPVGWTVSGIPVYPAQGGRSGGGVQFAVGDDDGDDPEFDDEQDGDDDRLPASMRGKASRAKTTRSRAQADDDDDDDDDDDQDDDADEDDPDDGWTPPDRDAYERLTTALKRANGEAGKRRRVGKAMDKLGIDDFETWLTARGIDPGTGRPIGSDVVDPDADDTEGDGYGPDGDYEREDDVRRPSAADERKRDRDTARQLLAAEQRGRRAERETMMPILAEVTARNALRAAGFVGTDSQLERALRTIDHDAIELDMDDSGFELLGIEEAIEGLREDFPTFFEAPKTRRTREVRETRPNDARRSRTTGGARAVDGGDRGRQPRKALGWAEQMVAQMEQRGR